MEHYIKLTPLRRFSYTARLRPVGDNQYQYSVFVPSQIYEVDENGLEDLKKIKLNLKWDDLEVQLGLQMNLNYIRFKYSGCGGCAKKKGLDTSLMRNYKFDMFVETDENGNILPSQTQGEIK